MKVKSNCNDDDECDDEVKNSVCHPLGFCHCPDGTVKTTVTDLSDIGPAECLPGRGILHAF